MSGVVPVGGSFVGGSKNDPFVADEARYFAQYEHTWHRFSLLSLLLA